MRTQAEVREQLQVNSGHPANTGRDLDLVFDGRASEGYDGCVLSFVGVKVAFGGVAALSGLTFDISPHSIVAVVGPNGAGKTTMLNAACGMLSKAQGDIRLMGEPILGKSPERIVRAGIGRSFQHPPLLDSESVLENVLVGDHIRLHYRMADQIWRRSRVNREEAAARDRAHIILKFLGLQDLTDHPVGGLPYGTRKLIDIARAVASGPHLLLLDEPTSGLDSEEREAVAKALTAIHRAAPVSILLVEHHMDIVRNVADGVIALEAGKVSAQGTVQEVLDSEAFQQSMVGGQTKLTPFASEDA
jgi:ABC-type branched-subunit amino acid transport system ATPase component